MKSSPPRRDIASAILIDTVGRYLFQQRDDMPNITEPGKIGLFGGHREADETFLECIIREVAEEISLRLSPERFSPLAVYEGTDLEIEGRVRAEFFVVSNIPVAEVRVSEGSLLIVEPKKINHLHGHLTAYARFALGHLGGGVVDRAQGERG